MIDFKIGSPYPSSDEEKFQILKKLPKFNSHCHLSGEIPLETLIKFANQVQKQALKNAMTAISCGQDYEKAFSIFPLISQIINTHEKLKEATYQTCCSFKSDNNQIVLMRTNLKSLENRDYEEYLKTVFEGIRKATSDDFNVLLMLSLKRSSTLEMAKTTIDLALKYREMGVVGIDISDISTIGDISILIPELLRAKESGLKIAVHMGESPLEEDQMLIINELHPDMIDHGVNLCKDAKKWIKQENTPVTVCLTSSIATKMHDSNQIHPWIKRYLKNNDQKIHLGTDDSTVFNKCLTDEYFKLYPDIGFEKVVQIANESFKLAKWIRSQAE
ncbi:MAG: hypothetical protein Q8K60_00025 [Parachlamydiaceae bacterium]|nr:hypothetical protein [Parachlamydiaceae bacterium]